MKYRILYFAALVLAPVPASSQISFPAIAGQVSIMENGMVPEPDIFLQNADFYAFWKVSAPLSNYTSEYRYTNIKNLYRTEAAIALNNQIEMAERMDSAMTARAKIETMNIADMTFDLVGPSEFVKIGKALERLSQDLITLNRVGTPQQVSEWTLIYKMLRFGCEQVEEGIMPNSVRHKQYLKIYSDVVSHAEALETLIRRMKILASLKENPAEPIRKADPASVASSALERWRTNASAVFRTGGGGLPSVPDPGGQEQKPGTVDVETGGATLR